MPGTLKAIALTKNRAPGAEGLLWNEPLGLAIDATTEGGTVYVRDTTPANNRYNEPLNGWLGSAGLLTNGGTSPKICQWNDGTLHWSAHNPSLHSQDFDNGYWTKSNSSISANATTAPDGTATADKLQVNTTNAFHYVTETAQGSYTVQPGQIWTWSVYAKAAELTWLAFEYVSGTMDVIQLYDLSNGVLGTTTSGTLLNPTITSVGNGWYRCSIAGESTGTNIHINIFAQNGDNITTFAGANTTDGIYIWGGQANRGLSPTTYLVTTTAAVYGIPQQYDVPTNQFGILIEPAATNLALRSQELDNAAWTKTNVTCAANNTTAPDGSTTADKITANAGNAGHFVTNVTATTIAAGTAYTVSAYLKNSTAQYVTIASYGAATNGDWFSITVDLVNGTITQTSAGATGTNLSSSITSVGNGWYRCVVSGKIATDSSQQWDLQPSPSGTPTQGNSGTITWNPAGTEAFFAWGLQQETGTFATTYIQTEGSSVTRAADAITTASSNVPYDIAVGSFLIYCTVFDTVAHYECAFDQGSGSGNKISFASATTIIQGDINVGGVDQAFFSDTMTVGTQFKSALRWGANDFAQCTNGGVVQMSNSGTIPGSITTFRVGYRADGAQTLNGYIAKLVYVPRKWENGTLQSRTA